MKKKVWIPAVAILGIIGLANAGGSDKAAEPAAQAAPAAAEAVADTSAADKAAADKAAAAKATAAKKAAAAKAAAAKKAAASKPAIATSSKAMIELLEGNALKAKNTYEGKRVTVSGFVGNIDASGDYFALDPSKDAFVITGIQVRNLDKFQDQVANFSKGQAVTVTGKITDVGELMGYSLKAEAIK